MKLKNQTELLQMCYEKNIKIAELEKENSELKATLNIRSCQNCRHNNKSCPNYGSCHNFSLWQPFRNPELAKAKEIIKNLLGEFFICPLNDKQRQIKKEAEQFLMEE